MITLHEIFRLYGIEPEKIRLVRHVDSEIDVFEAFHNKLPRFEAYQSFQKPNKFGDATAIAVFASHYKTTSLFLGVWDICGCKENKDFTEDDLSLLKKFGLPENWFNGHVKYNLRKNNAMDDLSERLVIEWGKGALQWVQKGDKEVVEIKGKQSIGDFQSFSLVDLTYQEVQKLTNSPDTNHTWVKALSSVNGVYLIKDRSCGKLYVGSAYGKEGIYGRWAQYAKNGHGGNLGLKNLDPDNFQFSILEIAAPTSTADDVIDCETRWKIKLGTREFGYNNN